MVEPVVYRVAGSSGPGADADSVEAVDLDELVGSDEVEVLTPAGLPALCASDVEYLDVATVDGDVVAGSDVAGEGDLGLPSARWTSRHVDSLLWVEFRAPAVSMVDSVRSPASVPWLADLGSGARLLWTTGARVALVAGR